ncbi:MAG: hypothetical protein KBF88_07375, partial [Polyangiaceae bacterium]|nr:hypothetical protein [Polyangiaceae bacterium]
MKLHFKLLLGAALTGLVGFTACGDTVPCGDSLAGGGFVGSGDCVGTADVSVDVQIDSRTDGAADTRTDGTTLEDGSTDGTTGDGSVATFSLGGSVTNLLGTGLVLRNGTDSLTVAKSATTYTLAGRVATGTAYAITANTQPTNPSQTCTVSNGAGTMGAANVTNANVTCTTDTFPVTVTVNGLKGTGLVLQNNGADDLSIGLPDAGNSTTGTFATKIASGADYAVTIKTQPADQSCTIAGATGTVVAGPITSVTVTCTNKTYMIGGAVSGLAGSGLVLQNNLGDDATINANGSFAFPTARESGTGYAVTVKTQPSNRTQVCTVTNGTGSVNAADVTNIGVTCVTTSFSVSATVSGLSGSGLVLQNNGGSNLAVGGNGVVTFSSSVLSGDAYAVTVLSNPSGPTQTCTVGNAAGTVGAANVTNVTVSCTTNKFAVGGNVSGLAGAGLVLQNNGGESLTVSASGTITFPTTLDSG